MSGHYTYFIDWATTGRQGVLKKREKSRNRENCHDFHAFMAPHAISTESFMNIPDDGAYKHDHDNGDITWMIFQNHEGKSPILEKMNSEIAENSERLRDLRAQVSIQRNLAQTEQATAMRETSERVEDINRAFGIDMFGRNRKNSESNTDSESDE